MSTSAPNPPAPAGAEPFPAASPEPRRRTEPLALAALVAAALFWPVGLVLSILALRRADRGDRVVPLVAVGLSALGAMLSGLALLLALLFFGLPFGLLSYSGDYSSVEAEPVPAETLALGEAAAVGRFSATVTEARFEPDDSRRGLNPFGEHQQRASISVALTNLDDDPRDPWMDLSVELVGSDGRQYWSEPCTTGPMSYGSAEVEPQQEVTLLQCVYVPESAVDGSFVLVAGADLRQRAYWRTGSDQ